MLAVFLFISQKEQFTAKRSSAALYCKTSTRLRRRKAKAQETTNSDSDKVARKKSEGGVEARLRERKRTATATRLRERKAKAESRRDQSDSAKPFPKRANRHRDVAKKRHHHQPAGRETRAFHKETDNLEDL